MASLWLKYEGTRFPIRRGETLVGRSAYCTIVISDPSVSREHAALRLSQSDLQIADLGSRNGTFVNGDRIAEPRALSAGDHVLVGRALLQVIAVEENARSRSHTTGVSITLEIEGDPTTLSQPVTLAFLETLVRQAADTPPSAELMRMLRTAVDTLLAGWARSEAKLTAAERKTVGAAADLVVSLATPGALDRWRTEIGRSLEAMAK